jgi:hypothetical protein
MSLASRLPPGGSEEGLRAALVKRGHIVEGFNDGKTGVEGLSRGLAKGVLGVGVGALGALQDIGQKTYAALNPFKTLEEVKASQPGAASIDPSTTQGKVVRQVLSPSSTSEKVGAGIAELASYVLPAAGAVKAVTAAGRTGLAARATAGAASSAASELANQGQANAESLKAAATSAAFDVGTAGIGRAARAVASSAAPRIVNSVVSPLLKHLSYGKNPGRAIAEEGITASNFDDLITKVSATLRSKGDELGATLKSYDDAGKTVNFSGAVKPIDEAIAAAKKAPKTNADLITRLENTKEDLMLMLGADKDGVIPSAIPSSARTLKGDIGDLAKWTGNDSDDKLANSAIQGVYANVRKAIEEVAPETKKINERISDLISAKKAAEHRANILERQGFVKFGEATMGAIGAAAGAIQSGQLLSPETAILALTFAGARRALSSMKFKTELASWLANSTPKQRAQVFASVPWLKASLVDVMTAEE